MKEIWTKVRAFAYTQVLHADDTPHRLALGVAIGMFVAVTPTPGLQMVLTLAIAAFLGANKVVGLPMVFLSNPVTAVPLNVGCWKVGHALTFSSSGQDGTHIDGVFRNLLGHTGQGLLARLFDADFWRQLLRIMFDFGVELWIGCIVVGLALGVVTYFFVRWGVTEYRQRRRVRKIYRNIRRAQLRKARRRQRLQVDRLSPSVSHV